MTRDSTLFTTVDDYIDSLFIEPDATLEAALRTAADAGVPDIHVSPGQGKLLYLLARLCGAKRILEIGCLAGYSTIWLARALPADGRLVGLEVDGDYATLTLANIEAASLAQRVELRVGAALHSLDEMIAFGEPPFDMVFLDADKANYVNYLDRVLKLSRPGSLILADNVIREGKVLRPRPSDESALGAAAFNEVLSRCAALEAIVIQQVGGKGHDGLAIARVT